MTWWEALILGVVQGLTEFFPVSSSGHLVIGQELLGLAVPGIVFDVAVHVATLFSVLIVYRAKIYRLAAGALRGSGEAWSYILKIVVATIPAVIVGFTLKDYFEARFDDSIFAGTMILVTGCVVWSSRWAMAQERPRPVELIPLVVAGAFSAIAGTVVPFLIVLVLLAAIMAAARWTAPREVHPEPGWSTALLMGISPGNRDPSGHLTLREHRSDRPLAAGEPDGRGRVFLSHVDPGDPGSRRALGAGSAPGGGGHGERVRARCRVSRRIAHRDPGDPLLRIAVEARELLRVQLLLLGRGRPLSPRVDAGRVTMTPATAASIIRLALEEDVGPGDRTTEWTVDATRLASATITAKADGVISGLDVAASVFHEVDASLEVDTVVTEGAGVRPGDVVLRVRGPARAILTAERVALNLLQRLSGVATLTRRYVDAVAGTGARILDTRKTTPGLRALEKRAVRAGGGANHRFGLHDMVLIKENHIAAAGGITAAVAAVRARNAEGLNVEVETTTLDEVREALTAGVDRILLDNMAPPLLREAVEVVRAHPAPRPETEASGGVSLETVRAIAATGVDFVSVGALTHSAPALDLSLLIRDG
jgi:nicotinate-nucleotide pyrophosphorylase (carboxylating)